MNTNDRTTVHIVIIFIGLIALALCGGMLYLNTQSQHIDPVLSSAASAALGAMTALLASTRSGNPAPAPVAVVNQDPIPVTDTTDEPVGRHAASDTAPVGSDLTVNDLTGD